MITKAKLSVIIVTYNSKNVIGECLKSISRFYDSKLFEVIVVDNKSSDGTCEVIESYYPFVKLIKNHSNLGFAKANNIGINESQSDFLLLLNPDTLIVDNSLFKMIEFLENNDEVSLVTCKLLNPDGSIQNSVRYYPILSTLLLSRTPIRKILPNRFVKSMEKRYIVSPDEYSKLFEIEWAIGACLMIRKSKLIEIGLLDEKYFMYFEDVDLCLRLRKAGGKLIYLHESQIIHLYAHDSSKRIGKLSFIHIMSMIYFFIKHPRFLFKNVSESDK